MKRNALLHLFRSGKGQPPIRLMMPEPKIDGKASITLENKSEHDMTIFGISVFGVGKSVFFKTYDVAEPQSIYVTPSEPALCIHLQLDGDSYSGYTGGETSTSLWPEQQGRIFWQGMEEVQSYLLKGAHLYVNLLIRPETLEDMGDNPIIKRFLSSILTSPYGSTDEHVFPLDKSLYDFAGMMLDELHQERESSTERIEYLIDCLIRMCLGEKVDVIPLSENDRKDQDSSTGFAPVNYVFSEREQMLMDEISDLNATQLKTMFYDMNTQLRELRSSVALARLRESAAEWHFRKVLKVPKSQLADFYFKMAQFLADQYKSGRWKGPQKRKLRNAIRNAGDKTMEWRPLTHSEMIFYGEWANSSNVPLESGFELFHALLSLFFPEADLDLSSAKDSKETKMLFDEKMRESFGFKHMSHFSGETAADKPIEVVETYELLMEKLSNTMTMDEEEGLKRSDAVRLLDNAYEYNDFMALLNMEIKYLACNRNYLGKQSDERIRWYIVALTLKIAEFEQEAADDLKNSRTEPLFLFRKQGSDIEKFVDELKRKKSLLLDELKAMKAALRKAAGKTSTWDDIEALIRLSR